MEYLDKLLPWMGEHWFLTIVLAMSASRFANWRPLTLVDARSHRTSTSKAKSKAGIVEGDS